MFDKTLSLTIIKVILMKFLKLVKKTAGRSTSGRTTDSAEVLKLSDGQKGDVVQ